MSLDEDLGCRHKGVGQGGETAAIRWMSCRTPSAASWTSLIGKGDLGGERRVCADPPVEHRDGRRP
jgi:hypothetical protein